MEQLFEIGKKYENQIGVYKVIEFIKKDQMKVTYDGPPYIQILNIELQSRILKNKTQKQVIKSERFSKSENPSSLSFYEALGYISKNCTIRVQVAENKLEEFEQLYLKRKGYLPVKNLGYLDIYENLEDKWGTEYYIRMINPKTIDIEDLDFYFRIKIHSGEKKDPNGRRICCKALGELLLDFGFDLGPNHDSEKILTKIPEQFQEAFKRGLQIT